MATTIPMHDLADVLSMPLSELHTWVKEHSIEDVEETIRNLDAIVVRATRMTRFMASIHGGRTYMKSLEDQNRAVKHVRKALGYTQTEDNLYF